VQVVYRLSTRISYHQANHTLDSVSSYYFILRRVWRYQRCNQNP